MPDAPPRFRLQIAMQRTTRILLAVVAGLALMGGAGRADSEPSARFLVVVLDAVPFEAALSSTRPADEARRLLSSLRGPVPMVSSFPSSTSVALTGILAGFGLEPSPGYEQKLFDRDQGRVRGGTLGSYGKIRFDWHYFFDWQLRGLFTRSKAYARPLKYNIKEIDRSFAAFEASDKSPYFVYVNSTDASGHGFGPQAFLPTFENIDRQLEALRSRSEEPIYLVLLSDHGLGGGDTLRNIYPTVRKALKAAGWRPTNKLAKPRDVALTPFGLVSSFEVYTHVGDEPEVARVLVSEPGVDLCAYPDAARWVVVDRVGRAIVERRTGQDGDAWAYRIELGDPLDYAAVAERLARGPRSGDFVTEARWFEQTIDAAYPDALFRLASAFELVQHPASIVCSVSDGYLYGSKSASFGAKFAAGKLHWTHGALGHDATLGFLMTDFPGWTADGAVRFDTALDFLVDHVQAQDSP